MRRVVDINEFANFKVRKLNKIKNQEVVFRNRSLKKLLAFGVLELLAVCYMVIAKENFVKLLMLIPIGAIGWNSIDVIEEFHYKNKRVRRINRKIKQLNDRCYR